jgi:hypothetical protein
MLQKNLLYGLGALMLILWAGQLVQAQSGAGKSLQKKACRDLWPVEQQNKWGYLDKTGQLIIPFKFDYATDFSEGLAAVEIKGKCGYIDKTGEFVIPPRFHWGYPFSEGLAVAVMRHFDQKGNITFNKFGYIDRSGKMVIQPQGVVSAKWLSNFSEGLACLRQNDKFGFIDKTGRQVIPPRYDDAFPFSEGLAAVTVAGKFGYIDRSGKMVIPPQFETVGPFSEGLAHIEAHGKQGYIDKSGKMVIKGEEFVEARGFAAGLAAARGKNGKYGFIDKTGNFVIPPQFHRVGDFSEGLAPVVPVKARGKVFKPGNLAYINHRGQLVIKSMSTIPDRPDWGERDLSYHRFCGGVARVGLGKKEGDPLYDAVGYINPAGKFIWPQVTPSKKGRQ